MIIKYAEVRRPWQELPRAWRNHSVNSGGFLEWPPAWAWLKLPTASCGDALACMFKVEEDEFINRRNGNARLGTTKDKSEGVVLFGPIIGAVGFP